MYPTVKDIMALSELRECYLLHPSVSCRQIIKSVTIMDNPNIISWLSGYEVLLSNGYSLTNFQNREWKQFFSGLVKKNVAALFIKLSYFVDSLPEEIVDYTAELDFPVVVVPNSYSWTKLSDPIQQYVIERQYYYVKEAIQLRDGMHTVMMQNGSLADLCSIAAKELGRPVAVFNEYWNLMDGSADYDWPEINRLLKMNQPVYREDLYGSELENYSYYLHKSSLGKVAFLSLKAYVNTKHLAILLGNQEEGLQVSDSYKVEQISLVMMLYIYKEIELSRIEKHYYTDFLLDLIDGVLVDKGEINKKAVRLERKLHREYQLMVCERPEGTVKGNFIDEILPVLKKEEVPIRDIMICERDSHLIFFYPVILAENRKIISKVSKLFATQLGNPTIQFGVSRCYEVSEISTAYGEALFALSVQQFVGRHVIYYEDLGLLRLFEANSRKADTAFLSEFYGKTILPLVNYDLENECQLTETLETLLKNEMSINKTAQILYLHVNTLRARIKRIEKITGCSLKAPMDIAELIIGIQIHRLAGGLIEK